MPNDHVLFNLLAWTAAQMFGGSEAVYRIWSVVPGIAAVGLVTWWLWRSWSRWVSVVFCALAVTSPLHLELVKQARGYGLGYLAGALMLVCAVSIAGRGGGRRALAGLALAGLVGTWTLTGFLIAFAGQLGALAPNRRVRRGLLLVGAVVGIGTLAFYAPLLHVFFDPIGHKNYFGASTGSPLSWAAFLTGPPDQFLGPTARLLLHVNSTFAFTAVGLVLAALGGVWLWRAGRRPVLLVLAGPPIFTELVLTVLQVNFNPRFVSFLQFHFLLLVAIGGVAGARDLARLARTRVPLILAGVALLAVVATRTVQLNDHWDAMPIENAKLVAQIVRRAGYRSVVTDSLKPWSLRYYLGGRQVHVLPPEQLQSLLCRGGEPLAFVDQLAYAEVMYAGNPVRPMPISDSCLRSRGARLVIVPERNAPERYGGLPVHVWLLCAPAAALGLVGCGGSHGLPAIKVKVTPAPRTAASACGKLKNYWQYAAGQRIGVAGKVRPEPSGRWHIKFKLKRCQGTAYGTFSKQRATLGAHGTFGVTLGPLPSGYYELRAELVSTTSRTVSRRVFFHVAG